MEYGNFEVGCVERDRGTPHKSSISVACKINGKSCDARRFGDICIPAVRRHDEKKSDFAGPRRRFHGVVIVTDDSSFFTQVKDILTAVTFNSV